MCSGWWIFCILGVVGIVECGGFLFHSELVLLAIRVDRFVCLYQITFAMYLPNIRSLSPVHVQRNGCSSLHSV